ncbi:MAG: hypothetical protein C5B51_07515 [Terriglobia bacterium]|nr:MAG: hypothetical protein C5B51_07515 [Terriglobia bacterium]
MYIRAIVAVGLAAGLTGFAQPEKQASAQRVAVCLSPGPHLLLIQPAQASADKILARAGVSVKWYAGFRPCPADCIRMAFTDDTPPDFMPEALAFAQPFEGVHIRIFVDRVQKTVEPGRVHCVLAHVMVHELGHILQGVNRHSPTGIMKARWDKNDYADMVWRPLPFTATDIFLIQLGLKLREYHGGSPSARLAAAREP